MNNEKDNDHDVPLAELVGFEVPPDPQMPGRVRRGINRNLLAGDTLELSFSGLLNTFWDYVKVIVESLTSRSPDNPDR